MTSAALLLSGSAVVLVVTDFVPAALTRAISLGRYASPILAFSFLRIDPPFQEDPSSLVLFTEAPPSLARVTERTNGR